MAAEPRLPPAIFLMGPTASGKTGLAMALRDVLPCDIISVDSTQVYRGLDIGSAKPTPQEQRRHPHRLIDIRDPAQSYSAAEFREDALREMKVIANSGRMPLLVGGSMLYFRVLLDGIATMPPADPGIREELERRAAREGWPALHAELSQVDPAMAARIHPNHSQRIGRALEVYLGSGVTMSAWQASHRPQPLPYDVTQLALTGPDRTELHRRIAARFDAMLAAGFVDEVRGLMQRGDLTPELPALRAVGYRQIWRHLAGHTDGQTMREEALAATRQLAKRQLTWLRGWQPVPQVLELERGLDAGLDPIRAKFDNYRGGLPV